MFFKLAWRNIWRSRRRSLITISSIFFAVIFAILLRTLVVGLFDKMINDTVSISYGYLQVQHTGYWENRSVDSTFNEDTELASVLNHEKGITVWAPHLESFAMASSGEHTKGIMLMGIKPEKENAFSGLSKKLIAGTYITDSDKSILLANGLAKYLKLKVNDTAVLLGQGYEGNMAAGKYVVKGIVSLGVPEMDKTMAWLPMAACRSFLSTGPRCSSISIMLDDRNALEAVKQRIVKQTKGMPYRVMTWQQMIPELNNFFQLEMDGDYGVTTSILYLVISFGIFGTILMMLNERMHEFGILIAVGMKKRLLAGVVVTEMFLTSIIGILAGMVVAFPIVLYFRLHPIYLGGSSADVIQQFNLEPVIKPSIAISNFIVQGYIILFISAVLSLYAIYKIRNIKVIQALNN